MLKLFKRFKTKFSGINHLDDTHMRYSKSLKYKVLKSNEVDPKIIEGNEIPWKEALVKMKGKDVILHTNYCGQQAYYELLEIDGQKLPKPELADYENYKNYDKSHFDAMEKRYEVEYKIALQKEKRMRRAAFLNRLYALFKSKKQ